MAIKEGSPFDTTLVVELAGGVASGDAGQNSLATSVALVQLLLPFM
jgi:hypothetical protein